MSGNDTIDPYPLIPKGARKILVVKKDIFEKLKRHYQSFYKGLAGQLIRQLRPKAKKKPSKSFQPHRERFYPYEPSPAIAVNECDYRRWCRVNEWFSQHAPYGA
jgi:hypothetical protein